MIKRKVTKGMLTTKATVVDSKTKRKLHEEEDNETIGTVEVPAGAKVARLRYVIPMKLSFNYNSIGIEIGIESYPVVLRKGTAEEYEAAFSEMENLVEARLAAKASGLRQLLARLSRS